MKPGESFLQSTVSFPIFFDVSFTNWTVSSDGRTYTFNLRQNVSFSNGDQLNAYQVWLQMYATYYLTGNSSGWLARVLEDWQTSWIVNLSSGGPASLTAQNMLYGRGVPDQVAAFDFKGGSKVRWGFFPSATGQLNGSYFEPGSFKTVRDPQCAAVAGNLQSLCTLQALADATSGQVILQNPVPGTRGNVGLNTLEYAGTWRADMALAKRIRIRENLRATIRMDAKNVFNHPQPGVYGVGFGSSPLVGGSNLNINSADPFGFVPTKGASIPNSPDFQDARQFELKIRLDF